MEKKNVFEPLLDCTVAEAEEVTLKRWTEDRILDKVLEKGKNDPTYVFFEGPPTANGNPGIHHVISRTLKDWVCRYKTMSGYKVPRKAGWDTHGLPVELQVEKQLGLSDKKAIEDYGVEDFCQKCRDSVFSYEREWRKMTERMAYSVDLDDPYITLDNNYIETLWWILDKFNKEGLLYEGHKILPYCPRCGTGLASHEVAQGYKEIKSNTLVAKFKKKGTENEYFLAWTTTPWTLPSNVALTVNAEVDYVKVQVEDEVYYLAKDLLDKHLGDKEYTVLETLKGKDLEYQEYEQLMPFVNVEEKAFFVTCGEYVTTTDGTGIVHSAPAFGEDDYNMGRKYSLPFVQPVDSEGKFTTTPWEGKFVMEEGLDVEIIKWLAAENKLFSKIKVEHNYPHCWRCGTPLVYYANPGWYIEMTKLKDKLIENNNGVNWYPEFVGQGRFGNWLEELKDWAISRTRYWGTPLPVWKCEDCGCKTTVGSRHELAELAIEDVDPETIELHRPYIDEVHLKCPDCGKPMTRVPEVIDCWFDSGAMPFAQWHYPFEHKEDFDQLFPADYICEGIDQTRGWFYSLLAVSTFVTGKAPYKNVLVTDLVLDKNGKKMSKSKGNTINPFEMFDKYGVDALRWYLLYVSPPWTPIRFDEDGLKEIVSKFVGTLKNTYTFFTLYANTDGIHPNDFFVDYKDRPELDRWILSKFNNLKAEVEENLEIFEVNKTIRRMTEFLNDDLSNWYIRRSRRRFWGTELTQDKKSVYNTTYEVLTEFCKLIAPFAPYLSEEMYRNLTGEYSVHCADYPRANKDLIDLDLEKKMDLSRDLVTLGRAARENSKIKVRQPIAEVLIDGKFEELLGDLVELIKEELNVKKVHFVQDLGVYMNFNLKPNFKVLGPKLGKNVNEFGKVLRGLEAHEVVAKLEAGESMTVEVAGADFEFTKEEVLVNIESKPGFNVAMENNLFAILDTTLTDDLVKEGLAREFISKVQQMRKASGFEVLDNINIYFNGDDEVAGAVADFEDYIKSETLSVAISRVEDADLENQNLNDHETGMKVERV
ncbi:MAG: isoleucine--tRNA ligase [Peptostreptococcus sp.]|jgi:isoleucyl-tRNA synthetase|uniref:Isoleucine--tRNA ligase n=1 Tax=Peptostreptococcus anaerobius TaxID=1261 RepID=A0A135YVU9_9FIRM|nr:MULTISPECIES: isoleucine--tRNA ligase [Peptostreptococcus]KXI13512.1 isoleucine--tRNA ligase [Peptostreptococcus anaerobius]MDK8277967.1 isoleucine--tRNA ligase [Peptostreptococcus anaerobius]MDU3422675.1 isoleucine--tRNA ligase [Peptostreptococcus anaerobius]MDU3429559.1 isoleucine--tRNA ligase [Peptostreptococcus sp.]MDU3454760.1 isoleucine--tRNA ligase [Peptostreptococcus sp.]